MRPAATVFGSARIRRGDPEYAQARECGRELAEAGFAVVTGGGPGVMEAANRGAKEGGGFSVGFNISLPHEQETNPYLDLSLAFRHFYARKVMLVKAAEGFVLFPGGFVPGGELVEIGRRRRRVVDPLPKQVAAVDEVDGQARGFVLVGEVAPQRVVGPLQADGAKRQGL